MTSPARAAAIAALLVASGCASTRIELRPEGDLPSLCAPASGGGVTQVTWWPQWRADQKEPEAREAMAEAGLRRVVTAGDCLGPATLRRRPSAPPAAGEARAEFEGQPRPARVLLVTVRELGPVLRLGSGAIVEGETNVVLELREVDPRTTELRLRSIDWRHGGPGVVKGVATLEDDVAQAFRRLLEGRPPASR